MILSLFKSKKSIFNIGKALSRLNDSSFSRQAELVLMAYHLNRMGIGQGEVGHNQELYGRRILALQPTIGRDDFKWLCNQLGSLYSKYEKDGCPHIIVGLSKSHAVNLYDPGNDIKFHDEIVNPLTKSKYWVIVYYEVYDY
jgi:hypothetical protein